jgi:hypothetical protein
MKEEFGRWLKRKVEETHKSAQVFCISPSN